ncbi:MAG TPA: hypothetical protein ACFE0H_05445 [Elainellaceae cyanobacterium]
MAFQLRHRTALFNNTALCNIALLADNFDECEPIEPTILCNDFIIGTTHQVIILRFNAIANTVIQDRMSYIFNVFQAFI